MGRMLSSVSRLSCQAQPQSSRLVGATLSQRLEIADEVGQILGVIRFRNVSRHWPMAAN